MRSEGYSKVHLVLADESRDDRCRWGFLLFHTLHLTGVLQKLTDLVKELPVCNRNLSAVCGRIFTQ